MPGPIAIYPLNAKHRANPVSPYSVPPGKTFEVTLADGPDGDPKGSYAFSGFSDSYIKFPSGSKLDTKYSITLAAMIYPEAPGPIFHYHGTALGWGTNLWLVDTDTLRWSISNRKTLENSHLFSSRLKKTAWNFIAVTYDYTTGPAAVWIDGVKVQQKLLERIKIATNYTVRLGAINGDDRYFKGRISCLQVYSRALAQDEILAAKSNCFNKGTFRKLVYTGLYRSSCVFN